MATQSEKWKLLQELDEATFRTDVLLPLLKRMEYTNVRERHGRDEYGKDITFREVSPLGYNYYAVIAKVGDISGAASGRKNLDTVQNQINMAFSMPIEDVETKKKHDVNHVIVWATGRISNHAERRIIEGRAREYRNIHFKEGQATIELLERYYPAFFTIRDPYVCDYYAAAKDFYGRLEELRTLGYSSEQHRLTVIFVPPTFTLYGELSKEFGGRHERVEYTFGDVLRKNRNTLIIGDAGSGKSTTLRRMLLQIIEENEQALRRSPIPILVECRKIDFDDPDGLPKALNREFFRFDSKGLAQELGADLEDGSVIVLLDGLDGLRTQDRITQAIGYIKDFNLRYPKTRVVLTSRSLQMFSKLKDIPPGYLRLEIKDLSPSQMVQFVKKWFGEESPIAQKLARLLRDPIALHGLPASPLVLTLIAILYESGVKEVPANLTELFMKYVELALGRWDISRDISLQYEWKVKEFILRKICWQMHSNQQLAMACADFESVVERLHSERGLKVDPAAFCEELVTRSEVLFRNDDDEYEFKHITLQHYFVGSEVDKRSDAFELAVAHFLEPWWVDAIFFACGSRPESDDYLNCIMDKISPSASESFPFAMSLGRATQATYLATQEAKLRAIDCVLLRMTDAWDDLCSYYESLDSEEGRPPHLLWVFLFSGAAQAALGSITLSTTLSQFVEELTSRSFENLSPRDRARAEWQAFLLACACVQSDNIEDFAKLFSSGIIRDPGFLLVGKAYAKVIQDRLWIMAEQKTILKRLASRIGKKLKGLGPVLKKLGRIDPMPLPSPDEK